MHSLKTSAWSKPGDVWKALAKMRMLLWLDRWVRISLAHEQADLNAAIFPLMGLWLLRIWFFEICMHSDTDEWILNGNTQYFPQGCQIMLWRWHNGGNHAGKFDQTYERYFTVKSVWTPKRALSDMDGDVGMALVGFLCVQKHPIKDTKHQLSSLNVQITKPKTEQWTSMEYHERFAESTSD